MPRELGAGACAYPVDDGQPCGAPRRLGSAYCPPHHRLCYLVRGSPREQRRLRDLEAIGGRVRRAGAMPQTAVRRQTVPKA